MRFRTVVAAALAASLVASLSINANLYGQSSKKNRLKPTVQQIAKFKCGPSKITQLGVTSAVWTVGGSNFYCNFGTIINCGADMPAGTGTLCGLCILATGWQTDPTGKILQISPAAIPFDGGKWSCNTTGNSYGKYYQATNLNPKYRFSFTIQFAGYNADGTCPTLASNSGAFSGYTLSYPPRQ